MIPAKDSAQSLTRFKRYKQGLLAEFLAAALLRVKGYAILEKRFRTGNGSGRAEIDLIARRGNTIVFVEVKSRKTIEDGLLAIPPAQQIRLRRAAESYLAKRARGMDARFDVIIVAGFGIRHFKNML
ncbi:MAG: YraN family protein [Rickettsiales bacterium]|jgi:putative endonuclease|nr:YraN family protein [Rickettsiales bacterium]